MTHICISKLTIIDPDIGLWPDQRQAIMWTNDEKVLIGPLGTNLSELSIESKTFSLEELSLKNSAKWRQSCLDLNVLRAYARIRLLIFYYTSEIRNELEISILPIHCLSNDLTLPITTTPPPSPGVQDTVIIHGHIFTVII